MSNTIANTPAGNAAAAYAGAAAAQTDQANQTGQGAAAGAAGTLPPAAQQLNDAFNRINEIILNQFSNTSTNRSGADGKPNADTVAQKLTEFFNQISDPDSLGALLIKFASAQRQDALDQRLQAREAAKDQLMGQAGETREAAQKQLNAAITSFALAIVSAAVSIAGASASGVQSTKGLSANKAGDMTDIQLQSQLNTAGAFNTAMGAGGQAITSAGGVGAGALNSQAKIDEAEGQELAAMAQESQSLSDISKKFMDELEEAIRSAIQFMKEQADAEANQMQALTRV